MEKVQNSVPAITNQHEQQLGSFFAWAVTTLHSSNFVHGDLRPLNILALEDNTVRIVDSDWVGRAGVVKYPADLNTNVEWHEDIKCGGLVQKEHDVYQTSQIRFIRDTILRFTR